MQIVRPMASGPLDQMVGFSIYRVPDSRVVMLRMLTPNLWKTESILDPSVIFLPARQSGRSLNEADHCICAGAATPRTVPKPVNDRGGSTGSLRSGLAHIGKRGIAIDRHEQVSLGQNGAQHPCRAFRSADCQPICIRPAHTHSRRSEC